MKIRSIYLYASAALLLFSASASSLAALDSIDDLFEDPPEDILEQPEIDIDHRSQFETSDRVNLRGSFRAEGGASLGWKEYPDTDNLSDGFGVSPGAKSRASLSFDARPSSILTIAGNIYTEIDPGNNKYDWSAPKFASLYADYNWLDKAFIRGGKFGMKWGQGRLYTPGNLMSGSSDGTALRITMPTVLDGVSFVTLANQSFAEENKDLTFRDLVSAGIADKVFGGVLLSAGARYQRFEGLRILGSFKTVLAGTDLLSDVVVHEGENENKNDYDYEFLAGFFREWEALKLYGEYYYDNRTEGGKDHKIGLAAGYKKIFDSSFDAGIEWKHAFKYNSGSIIPGITWAPWRLIRAKVGVPILYGDNYKVLLDEDNNDLVIPGNRKLSLAFSLELSSSF